MERALSSFLKFRLDAREHLSRSLAADPEFGLAHCLKGYFAMLLYKQAGVAPAAQSARTARALVARATAREQPHAAALYAWAAGRAAVELDAADLWATHAVAHIMEMQDRHDEGIAWLGELEPHWAGANNLLHHLWWHRALFHLERREFDVVLDLYDRRFRDLNSQLAQLQPDFHIDIQNAASMLFRLERHDVGVGDRWIELADKAEKRIGDCRSPFTLPHWLMALAATGRDEAAQRMLDAMRAFSHGRETIAPIVGEVALPVGEAVLAHRRGQYFPAVDPR